MPQRAESAPLQDWLAASVSKTWPGSRLGEIVALKGDASTRRFWRIWIEGRSAPATAIAVDLGPDDLPLYARALHLYREPLAEPPYINVHRFLESIGAPVPKLYCAAPEHRALLVEDVGDEELFAAALADPAHAADLYRVAIDELLRIHVDGTARKDPRCVAFGVAYDARLFGWELEQFAKLGLREINPGADAAALQPELAELAARLGRLPRVFSHRDYHGQNLFLQRGSGGAIRIRILDFQDALMAPAAQDLSLLMTTRDTARAITPEIESRLLDYYQAGLARRRAPQMPHAEFLESYRLCVIQHALKLIGRFLYLEQQGKRGYAAFVPHAAAQARRMLARGGDFPQLKRAFGAVS
jgi:aminoglycoside/choline kinase family phosphotransferase